MVSVPAAPAASLLAPIGGRVFNVDALKALSLLRHITGHLDSPLRQMIVFALLNYFTTQ